MTTGSCLPSITRARPSCESPSVAVSRRRYQAKGGRNRVRSASAARGKTLLYTLATARSINRWDNAQIVVQSLSGGEPKVILDGGADARYVSTGHLVYAVGGILRAVPFDLSRLQVTGESVDFLEGIL